MALRCLAAISVLLFGVWASPASASVDSFAESFLVRDTSTGASGDFFGFSVAIEDDTLAIGAPGADGNAGAVYLYARTGGAVTLRKVIIPDDQVPGDLFGYSVDLDDGQLIVGAPWNDDKGVNAGAVYIFDVSTSPIDLVGKFYSVDELAGEEFGTTVGIDGDVFIAGSPYNSTVKNDEGAVNVYEYDAMSGWIPYQLLRPKLSCVGALYGFSIAIDGTNIVVGAPGSDDGFGNPNLGAAYVYAFDPSGGGFAMDKIIESSSPEVGSNFGAAVGVKNDLLAVGAPNHGSDTGLVDIYVDVTGAPLWSLFNTVLPADTTAGDAFGYAIDISASTVFVGSPYGAGLGPDTGCVHGMRYNPAAGQFMEEARFYSSELVGSDIGGMGSSVASFERQLLAGAPLENGNQGSALLFTTDRFWINPAGGLWDDSTNWSGGVVPEFDNPVVIPVPGVYTIGFPFGQLREVQSLDVTDGLVSFNLNGSKLTCNGTNGKGLIVADIAGGGLQLGGGTLEILSNGVVGDGVGSSGLLQLDQALATFDDTLSIGEQGFGQLSLGNSSVLEADRMTIGNNGGEGLVESGPGDSMYFDPFDPADYGVSIFDGTMFLNGSFVDAAGEGVWIDSAGTLRATGAVVGELLSVGTVDVPPGVPGGGSVTLDLLGNYTMLRTNDMGMINKGVLTTTWDGSQSSSLDVSQGANLSGLYTLDVPGVNTVTAGDLFNVLTAAAIEDDFDCYLVPYVDEDLYFKFSQGTRRGTASIDGEVDQLSIPFGFNAPVSGPSFTGDARSIEPIDVDEDGDIDLVVLATDTDSGDAVCVLLNENGTLCMDSMLSVVADPTDMDSGDFDDDGDVDLAITGIGSDELQILENDGAGVFSIAATYSTGDKPIALSVFDWNNDALADIALVNQDDDTLYVYTNTSSLRSVGFGVPTSVATSDGPVGISPGEIDNPGDKQDDIVVAGGTGEITYHHNTGGAWGPTVDLDVNTTIGGISVLDLDLDDIDDVLVTYPDDAEAGLHYGPSNDINSVDLPIDSTAFSVIDMDGDGDDDVIGGGGGGPVGRGTVGLRVVRNDTESGSVVFMDIPAGGSAGLSALSTGMLVDADSYPDLLTVLNADDVTEFSLGVQTSSNGLPWIPDVCAPECPGDSDGSGSVDVGDLLNVIGDWGSCGDGDCPGDIDGDGEVNVSDLLTVIANWGSC